MNDNGGSAVFMVENYSSTYSGDLHNGRLSDRTGKRCILIGTTKDNGSGDKFIRDENGDWYRPVKEIHHEQR